MKQTTKTSRTAGYLEKIFRELNKDSFGGELEEPIITIQSTSGAYGHVTVAKTWKRKDDWRHELNISADYLQRPIENVVATMIHEMVHLYNIQHNIQDCSRGGTYHNRKFKEEAEKHMIHIEKHDKYGWTLTSPTDELLEYIISKDWTEVDMGRGFMPSFRGASGNKGAEDDQKPTTDTNKRNNSRRYQCPCCKNIVRATKDLNIICGDCNVEYELTN